VKAGFSTLALAALLTTLATLAHADTPAPDGSVSTTELAGTVGPYRVGASLTIKDYRSFVEGHYFYATTLANIPLTGTEDGPNLTLTEPGGGVFHLTLQSNGSQGAEALTFYTSTALVGTWTKDGKTLPVKLGFDFELPGGVDDGIYHDVTDEPALAYEAKVQRFLKAAIAGDKAGASAWVVWPLTVNGKHAMTSKTPAALEAHWGQVFTPALIAQLRTAIPHEMFVHEGQVMVAGGAAWFGANGLTALNLP
jgi:hypothetical protein